MVKVKINDLSNEIARQVALYTDSVKEEVELAKEDVANNIVSELKESSPKQTGGYAKGWRKKKQGNNIIVHNATDYQLTHLLEYGHVNRDGGRTKTIPHIRPAEEKAITEFVERVERAIKS